MSARTEIFSITFDWPSGVLEELGGVVISEVKVNNCSSPWAAKTRRS